MSADMDPKTWPFPAASAGRMSAPQGWPAEAVAHAMNRAAIEGCHVAIEGCRVDAVRIRGRLRDLFNAYDVDGSSYVHVVVEPTPRRPTRVHGLLQMGRGEAGDNAARRLVRQLRTMAELELRGSDLRVYRAMVGLEAQPTHFQLVNAWLASAWTSSASTQPAALPGAALTTEPPASTTAREAA